MYIIISLEHSTDLVAMYWRDNGGYSDSLVGAGTFTEEEVKMIFQRPFVQALPVPCTRDAFLTLGLYPTSIDFNALTHFELIRL
jgi:hypothetical protein